MICSSTADWASPPWHRYYQRFDREPLLVLIHAHLDHMGSAHEFSQAWAHPLEHVDDPAPGTLYGPTLAARLGLDEALPPALLTTRPHSDYDLGTYRLQPATPTRSLADGDTVDLGDRALTVLHLPGHRPGSIALFDEHDGTLFSGDASYDDDLLNSLPGSDTEQYAHSLRWLRDRTDGMDAGLVGRLVEQTRTAGLRLTDDGGG